MAKARARPASIDRITLPDLADNDGALLRSGDDRGAERYTGIDLGGATVQRLMLQNCRIGTLDVTGAKLKDVDLRGSDFSAVYGLESLRGATIDDAQLSLLAPLLAAHLGLRVE